MVESYLMESVMVSLFALREPSVAITAILLNADGARPVIVADQIVSELFYGREISASKSI